jgi:hypothetical protein
MPDSTGDNIGSTISTVGAVVSPIVAVLDPPIGAAVTIAFKLLAVLEPAAYNAVAALISGQDLTPEQEAEIARVSTALEDPDSYLKA